MAQRRLDEKLLTKLSRKLKKPIPAVNVIVSHKAAKLSISSEAALILLAKQHGIGTAVYQQKLDPSKQAEVRESLPLLIHGGQSKKTSSPKPSQKAKSAISNKSALRLAIEYMIQDQQLISRCGDLLLAKANFDRAINQATLILEDRVRIKAKPAAKLVGENLVNYAFNADLLKTVLKVSDDPEEQRGFTNLIRGIVPAFRNKTHHHLIDTFAREEAMRVCGFIDVLLRIVDKCAKVQ